ncbi:MAG: hypothetical protein AAGC71_15415 [Pseudomonadota bacterium]
MKLGPLIFVVVIGAYIGMEMYAAKRNAYRMQPDHIHEQFVRSSVAVARCGAEKNAALGKFDRNFDYARGRALAQLTGSNPDLDDAAVKALLTARIEAATAAVDALVAEHGCQHIELWKLKRRHANLAGMNLPVPRS